MTQPAFYAPEKVGTLYTPDTNAAIAAGNAVDVAPASEDSTRTALLLIDAQVDFIHEDGALYVPGAIEDTRRTIEWIFNNIGSITKIYGSLDSHLPN
ncbi:MAG: nicotinamidase, partial [Chloroflexota bacterium]